MTLLAFLATAPNCQSRAANEPRTLAITQVTIVDPGLGVSRGDMTVIVVGNRIRQVAASSEVPIPAGAEVLDARGKFLIPGLWDMHVHAFSYSFPDFTAPLLVANGVTGARDMGYYVDTAAYWRGEVATGRAVGPRLVVGGRLDGPSNHTAWVSRAATAADARRAVDTLLTAHDGHRRADFIKVYSWLPRDAYFAAAGEVRSLGATFAGHVPYAVNAMEASDAGQRSIEHEDDLMRACSSSDAELRASLADTARHTPSSEVEFVRAAGRRMTATFDPPRCRALLARLAANGTWVTPTLVVYQPYAHAFDSATTHPELLGYVPRGLQREWRQRVSHVTPADTAIVAAFFSLPWTAEMQRAGVHLLAGTDTPLPYVFPGFSLHDELSLLVHAGLSPMQALRTATYEPAAYLKALDSLGTIEQGKVADLVLLDADPLLDIGNTRRVAAVILNGRLIGQRERQALLARARAFARASR